MSHPNRPGLSRKQKLLKGVNAFWPHSTAFHGYFSRFGKRESYGMATPSKAPRSQGIGAARLYAAPFLYIYGICCELLSWRPRIQN
jgi:hypothetical protein